MSTPHSTAQLLPPIPGDATSSRRPSGESRAGRRPDRAAPRKADKAGRPLRNTPPVALDNIRLFAELFGDPQANAARWFVATIVLGGVVAAQAIAISRMLPLKQAVPYAVEYTADGAVVRVVEAAAYHPTSAVLKSELARWVERLLVIDPYLTRENLRLSTRPLRGKAVSQHKDFVEAEAPFKRLLAAPGLVRTARTSGVDVSQNGIAFVFVTTTERSGTGEAVVRKWRFTVHYVLTVPDTEENILANPAGLNITHFERAQDLS
ncbi:VirB8/TrbF family protein [Rhizobacter sp. LjRoot28]|uniref:VirB8/TrbF family protein n=1 Tax=Rhizobacter sp. LjRoot28 TaxID=3342309 RepID=UPI003ECEFB2A